MPIKKPIISIIFPVYNEEDNVRISLSQLISIVQNELIQHKKWPTEIIIIDDGSTDRSLEIITETIEKNPNVKLLQHGFNRGKGSGISTALRYAEGSICIIQDADLEYNPAEIAKIVEPLIKGKVHVVYGSRFLKLQAYRGLWSNLVGNLGLSFFASFFIRRRITDMMTCYKAFRRDLVQDITARSFDVEPELTAKLLLNRNIQFMEIPISYHPRLKGKKIRKIDGFISLWRLIKTIRALQKKNQSQILSKAKE